MPGTFKVAQQSPSGGSSGLLGFKNSFDRETLLTVGTIKTHITKPARVFKSHAASLERSKEPS